MVTIRPVADDEVEHATTLHNRFTAQDRSTATVQSWYAAVSWLFLFAVDDTGVIGVCTGRPRGDNTVSLAGIGFESHRRGEGIGTRLLDRFEENARRHGIDRISVASAGGQVDAFYLQNGFRPESILVMNPAGGPGDYEDTGFAVTWDRTDDGSRKCYVDVTSYDEAVLETVRDVFEDENAIYIMVTDCSSA